jgi:methyl-accepting chemotaxis protein
MKLDLINRLRIGTRVYLGFAVTLLLVAVLGTMAVGSLKTTETSFNSFAVTSDNTVKATQIEGEFIALRRAVFVYATNGSDAILAQARELVTTIRKHITGTADGLAIAERKTKLQEIGQAVDRYSADFDNAVKLRIAREKLIGEQFLPLGAKTREDVTKVMQATRDDGDFEASAAAGEVQEALMLMRVDALQFLRIPDRKFVDSFNQRVDTFRRTLDKLAGKLKKPDHKRLAQDAGETVSNYTKMFAEIGRSGIEIDTLINKNMTGYANTVTQNVAEFVRLERDSLDETRRDVQASTASSTVTMIGIAVGALVLGLLIAFLIARSIVKPVSGLTGGMKELADGNFDVILPGLDRKDEVGEMAQAVETFKVKLAEKARREAEEKAEADRQAADAKRLADEREAAAQRAAQEKAAAERKAAMYALADQFEKAVGGIIDTVSSASTELEAAAQTLTKTAETTQHLSTVVASASEEASANVQSVASATEEMTGSVAEISRQVQESSSIADQAVHQAQNTNARITELSQAANRIGDVVKLITAIAEQTNLLALNATIEAARAGEAGKGFAVVAQEVKALAAQTAKATGEIGAQITGMQQATDDSVTAIKEIGATIGHISQIATAIAAAVEEQGAATQEIARNVGEAAKGTAQVANNITDVNHGAAETGSASSQVLSSAQSLATESNRLKVEVQKFLETVRAA